VKVRLRSKAGSVPISRRAEPAIGLHGVVQLASLAAKCLATCKRRRPQRARPARARRDRIGTSLDRSSMTAWPPG